MSLNTVYLWTFTAVGWISILGSIGVAFRKLRKLIKADHAETIRTRELIETRLRGDG